MSFITVGLALLIGYFSGAISFTRILGRWFAPGEDLSETIFQGPKAGCLVSILDMLKAALPTLAIRLLFPGTELYWLTAAAAVVGHNFPVYYKFKGGRGMSPLYGGLFVLDWMAIPATTLAGVILGFMVGDMFLVWIGSVPMLLLWVIFRHGTLIPILYAVVVNIFFWAAILPELQVHIENRRSGNVERTSLRNYFRGAGELFSGRMKDKPQSEDTADVSDAINPDEMA